MKLLLSIVPVIIPTPPSEPCVPSPCGPNAICKELHGAGSCTCQPGYFGDPYLGCRPECVQNSDCYWDKACVNYKCVDPCSGACGLNAECKVVHHSPTCFCIAGYTGNPISACRKIIEEPSKALALFVLVMVVNLDSWSVLYMWHVKMVPE